VKPSAAAQSSTINPKAGINAFDEAVLKSLESLAQGSPADVLLEAALALNTAPLKEIVTKSRLDASTAEAALKEVLENGQLLLLEDGKAEIKSDALAITLPHWNDLRGRVENTLDTYHKQFSLRRGIPREELKSRLKLTPRIFNAVIKKLVESNTLKDARGAVSRLGHEIKFDTSQQVKVQEMMRKFAKSPYATPSVKECQAEVGEEIVSALIEMGELVAVSPDVIFRKQDYDGMVEKIKIAIQQKERITLGEVRDMLDTTRKYVQALLEHLDAIGVTMRDGDARKLRK
jgi:selenocysteine-specific elongation factor